MTRYTAPDIYRIWRYEGGRRALRALPPDIEITTPRLEARAYADLADGLLSLHGPKRWVWRDATGRSDRGQGFLRSAFHIGCDVLAAPVLPRWHAARARRLQQRPAVRSSLLPDAPPLYLRTDHMFDLRAGGSVAHTSGVLNALRALCGPVDVISTDRLALVETDDRFHILTPRYGLGRNLPNMPLLGYNDQLLAFYRGRAQRPRFVYARYSLGNYAGLAIARAAGAPFVCEYNGSNIWISRNWDTQRLPFEDSMLAIEDANLFGAELVIAVSNASKDELVGRGVPEGRVLVNPNGVDVERFDGNAGNLRATLKIAPDETVIGFVGTFGQWHGTGVLARAFARLLALLPDRRGRLRLLMIGDGNLRPEAEEILQKAGAADRAVFTGTVPQHAAPAYLAACDILVSPHVPNPDGTPFFGSPTKLFEYMAARRAIVASDLDQVGEVLAHEETALLVRPGDAEVLAGAMMRAVTDDALRARLGDNARAVCEANHTWMIHTRRILEALTAVSDTGTLR